MPNFRGCSDRCAVLAYSPHLFIANQGKLSFLWHDSPALDRDQAVTTDAIFPLTDHKMSRHLQLDEESYFM